MLVGPKRLERFFIGCALRGVALEGSDCIGILFLYNFSFRFHFKFSIFGHFIICIDWVRKFIYMDIIMNHEKFRVLEFTLDQKILRPKFSKLSLNALKIKNARKPCSNFLKIRVLEFFVIAYFSSTPIWVFEKL